MPSDTTTFFAAFAAIALAIGAYLWHLERRGRKLEERLVTLEAMASLESAKGNMADGDAARKAGAGRKA